MRTCIKCGREIEEHSICPECVEILLNEKSPEELVALARLGQDVIHDAINGIKRPKGYLAQRYKDYELEERLR